MSSVSLDSRLTLHLTSVLDHNDHHQSHSCAVFRPFELKLIQENAISTKNHPFLRHALLSLILVIAWAVIGPEFSRD